MCGGLLVRHHPQLHQYIPEQQARVALKRKRLTFHGRLLECCRSGDSVDSPIFSAAGLERIQFHFFPRGYASRPETHAWAAWAMCTGNPDGLLVPKIGSCQASGGLGEGRFGRGQWPWSILGGHFAREMMGEFLSMVESSLVAQSWHVPNGECFSTRHSSAGALG